MRRECFDAGEIRKLQLEAVLVHTANKHVLNRENFPRVVEPLDERKGIITGHDLFPNSWLVIRASSIESVTDT